MGFLRRKRPSRLEHVRALGDLQDAMGRAEEGGGGYERVCTAQGRKAHLQSLSSAPGVLCGWPGPWVPADPSLPVCRLCEIEAEVQGMAAS